MATAISTDTDVPQATRHPNRNSGFERVDTSGSYAQEQLEPM